MTSPESKGHRPAPICRRVLMVGTSPQTMGGIATVVRGYTAGGLFERFDCTYVVTHRDGAVSLKAWIALKAYLRVLFLLLRHRDWLVHVHLSSRASFWRKSIVCLMAITVGRPYFLHVHGSEFMQFYERECGRAAQRFVRWTIERAAVVLALSPEWRSQLFRICPAASVEVLVNAVPVPFPGALSARPADVRNILFLGRLGRRKGVFDLIRAFARISVDFPATRLICAGDGEIDAARALARDLGMADRIECPGWQNEDSVRHLILNAGIFVLPSYAEGLPMALLEAMSWQLAVIATPVGGIPQVIRHGENGLLIAPGDVVGLEQALSLLLSRDDLRTRLAAAARATIQATYSLEASLDRLNLLYDRFGLRQDRLGAGG